MSDSLTKHHLYMFSHNTSTNPEYVMYGVNYGIIFCFFITVNVRMFNNIYRAITSL